jgi:hypothetical protein
LFYSEHLGDIHSLLEKSGADSYVERMDLEDYLFRFDRGVFWLAQVRKEGGREGGREGGKER